jgi:hypothetical protein
MRPIMVLIMHTIDKIRSGCFFRPNKGLEKGLTPEEALRKRRDKTNFDKQAYNSLQSC